MPLHNSEVAQVFSEVADLLEIEGANEFRIRAYRKAARTIRGYPHSMSDLVEEGQDLTELSGIGKDLASKIEEIVKTGGLRQLEEVKQRTPASLAKMLKIEGLGPKRVQQLYQELEITNLDQLEQAASEGRIRDLDGLGPKTEETILQELSRQDFEEQRTPLNVAEEMARPLVTYLEDATDADRIQVAGSYRRRKETVGDLDVLAISDAGEETIQRFVEYEDVDEIVSQGETRSTVVFRSGLQVDLRVVPQESYGAALFYFTGSKDHNIAVRNLALEQDLKVNEYGVFRNEEQVAGKTEEGIYELFDLAYVPPELREDRGELAAAREGRLPELVTLDDIRGDLQMHTTGSDGDASLEKMARAAMERGYEYVAITDHSPNVAVAQGLDAEALARQIDDIDRLNNDLEGIIILKAIEVDILQDGSLDLPNDILDRLDLCICSVHSYFDLSREKQTERIIQAMDNPYFNILAHPTGRRIGERAAYDVDLERVMEAALERGCFLEINAHPERLDLDDVQSKMAKDMGLKLAINTDAHSVPELDYMRFGVGQARRGWLETEDVLNTRSWPELKAELER
ncbi:MAG: DNA polymerase/3'-5' exonuclease PolX [Anaerolineae bacterium]